MIKEEYKYSDITEKIIGCCMTVHNTLGLGFPEYIYQRALEIEIRKQKLNFVREKVMPIYYDNIEIGNRRVDFLVEDKIMLELKAIFQLDNIHFSQTMNYIETYKLEIGLLINFGNSKLEFKRLVSKKNLSE